MRFLRICKGQLATDIDLDRIAIIVSWMFLLFLGCY